MPILLAVGGAGLVGLVCGVFLGQMVERAKLLHDRQELASTAEKLQRLLPLAPSRALVLVDSYWGSGEHRTIRGIVSNTSDRACARVSIQFNVYNARSNLVGNASDSILNLDPHGTWRFEAGGHPDAGQVRFALVAIRGVD